jgi:hypothetical protein
VLNYPGARHHDCCQLYPGGSEPPRKIFLRVPGDALGCTAKIVNKKNSRRKKKFPMALQDHSQLFQGLGWHQSGSQSMSQIPKITFSLAAKFVDPSL